MTTTNPGLEGVLVADTRISDVDGERGALVIAGADVEQLARTASFEQAAARVVAAGGGDGDAVTASAIGLARASAWRALTGQGASEAWGERGASEAWGERGASEACGDALDHADGMDALRTALGHVRATGSDLGDAIAVIGAAPVLVAAWSRRRAGQSAIAPDPTLGHAADYLRMTTGRAAAPDAIRALDAYLVTVIDHAMSASTFTARVIASTQSDLISAVIGAIGALKGPLHGGAPGPVLDMFDAIGAPDHAEEWLLGELASGRRIMGMGHRVYRVRDPRAAVLEQAVRPLQSPRLDAARAIEHAAANILRERKPDRSLAANVEFYTAVLLDAVGLPREQFAPTFAVSRIAGWSAHVIEQHRSGRLIRPASHYIGLMP